MARSLRTVLAICVSSASAGFGSAPEPWPLLHGGGFTGAPQPFSPDPLVSYVWPDIPSINDTILQIFPVAPASCGAAPGTPASSFSNASSCGGTLSPAITVSGAGTLLVDFGVELPGWFEFDSPDIQTQTLPSLLMGISEYTRVDWVGGFKEGAPKRYGATFRLETNGELYEGVRFGFIKLTAAPSAPFTITGLRAVSQAKPVNYVGSFSSAGDPVLERVWYTAAYTVRATLQSTYMGSVLMDRGDRFSWTGDAHPSQATSMAAFGNFPFVFNNLNRSKADCQGIATYCLYFVLSVADYYEHSGDAAGVAYLAPNVIDHLDSAARMWADPQGLRFVGWDDRTGSGFANNTTPETQNLYRLLAIRAWRAAAGFLAATGSPAAAARYAALADNRTADIRAMGGVPWWRSFGLHAGADAVNAGFLTPDEAAGVAGGAIGDIVQLPSQSNFNQYFILQALSGLGQLDRGVESVRAVWGPITALGATTFWETSHPSAAAIFPPGPPPPAAEQSGWVSYCHPWASGPTPWLTRWVTGVRPLAPGYARVLVAPHVGGSMRGVRGAAATPHGPVGVEAAAGAGGEALISVRLPAGVARGAAVRLSAALLVRLGVPLRGGRGDALTLGGGDGLAVRVARVLPGGAAEALPVRVATALPADAPLVEEAAPLRGRCAALEVELPGGAEATYEVAVSLPGASAVVAGAAWAPEGSPFPPPVWPGRFAGADATTGGSWLGAFGAAGHVLLGFDKPPQSGANPFCGVVDEGATLHLQCVDAGASISGIDFASFGTPVAGGNCPAFARDPSCDAPASMATVASACVGKASCSVDAANGPFGGDPCPGISKQLAVVARCSSGGGVQPGENAPPADRVALPPWVAAARTVDYDGYCGKVLQWTNGTDDRRALADPADASRRALGLTQPCGCPTSPFDIRLTDDALAAGKRYRLGLYFVDYAPSPGCGAFDGTNRTQEVYLLTGYPEVRRGVKKTRTARKTRT